MRLDIYKKGCLRSMGNYTCPAKGCDWTMELFYHDGDGIRAILDHENGHKKETREVKKSEKEECTKCDGKGYIERWYTIDEDVPSKD